MGAGKNIEQTSSFRVAGLLMVFLFISIFFEHSLHSIKSYLVRRGATGLLTMLEKTKEELMLVGLLSMLLTVCETPLGFCTHKTRLHAPALTEAAEKGDQNAIAAVSSRLEDADAGVREDAVYALTY